MPRSTHAFSPDPDSPDYCRCGLHRDELDHTGESAPVSAAPVVPSREAELLDRINKILTEVGSFAHCKGCAKGIFWVKNKRGSNVPYTPEGINHFTDCPNGDEFRRSVNR